MFEHKSTIVNNLKTKGQLEIQIQASDDSKIQAFEQLRAAVLYISLSFHSLFFGKEKELQTETCQKCNQGQKIMTYI